jgi:magnesium-transporting ATPase (P-type)
MEESHVLYTANEGKFEAEEVHMPRWGNMLFFVGVMLAIGIVLGLSLISGEPRTILFVKTAFWVMGITVGVFVLMLLIDRVGLWGLLALIPLTLLGILWVMGVSGQSFIHHVGQELTQGAGQVLKVGLYTFAGLVGLSLLARLIDKVGIAGFLATIVIAMGVSIWLIGG